MIRHPFLRFLAWLGCLVCLMAAVGTGLATAWFWQAFSGQGMYSTSLGRIPVDPQARAIVMDIERIEAGVPNLPVRVQTLLTVKPSEDRPGAEPADLFIGLASAPTVDEYLVGSPYAVARLDGQDWSMAEVPGEGVPGSLDSVPWIESASGPAPSVAIDGSRPITVAILNGDQSPPVDVRLFLVARVVDATTYQAWAIGVAVGLTVMAWTLGYVAMVRLAPRQREWTS